MNHNTKANPEYKYFVYNIFTHSICAGNEYKEDAQDVCDEYNELYYSNHTSKHLTYRVFSGKYIQNKLNTDPYNFSNWDNPSCWTPKGEI